MTRHRRPSYDLLAIVGTVAVAASALALTASPAAAATCPVVNPTTHVVTPAPAPNTQWQGCNLIGANLSNANLKTSDLSNANLKDADLSNTDLTGSTLTGATVSLADFTDATLVNVGFGGTDMNGAILDSADLHGANLSGAILTGSNVRLADFTNATFNGVTSGNVVSFPNFLPADWKLKNGYFLGYQAKLVGADLEGESLLGVDLRSAILTNADLQNANLRGAELQGSHLQGTKLLGAQLQSATSGSITGTPFSLPVGWRLVGGYLVAPPSYLRVTTTPAVASQITIDGDIADSWGLRWVEVSAAPHTVCFRAVPGYVAPSCAHVTTEELETTTVDGAFSARGYLRVITSPAVASQITVDGVPRNDWGVWTEFAVGTHQVCFGAVAGFNPPSCQTVAVTAGATTTVTGTFTANAAAPAQTGVGFLRVTTSPPVPALISVDGVIADTWGLNWLKVAPGAHQVCFGSIEGYSQPSCAYVDVLEGTTSALVGTFPQRGFLKVETSPAVAGTIKIDGKPADAWGVFTDVPAGSYEVCFGEVPGKTTPACATATVTAGAQTTTVGTYANAP